MSVQPDVEQFLAVARAALPGERIEPVKVRTFGQSAEVANQIIPLILSGAKTGTFALDAEFDGRPEARPAVGDWYVVTWFDGRPALLYRVTEVETLPFDGIDARHVAVEGPRLREVSAWRRLHWDYWTPLLHARGLAPSQDMPVVFHRFALRYSAAQQRPYTLHPAHDRD